MTIELPILIAALAGALVVGAAVAGIVAYRAGIAHRKKVAEAAIGSAEAQAERICREVCASNRCSNKNKVRSLSSHRVRLSKSSLSSIVRSGKHSMMAGIARALTRGDGLGSAVIGSTKWTLASDTPNPEFCMPTSMEMAF